MRLGVLLMLLTLVPAVRAQVACTSPDDLCTGDPCETGDVTVASTCQLDFGTRTLVVRGTMRVPDGGVLELRAGNVQIFGGIEGKGVVGPSITVIANGDILQRTRVDSQGHVTPGSVTLRATGNIRIESGGVRAPNSGQTGSRGGQIVVEAGGTLDCIACRIEARGRPDTPAGSVALRGAAGVYLPLGTHWDAGGGTGGTFEVSSTGGPIFIETDVRAHTTTGPGGTFTVSGVDVTLKRDLMMDGGTGGSVIVDGKTILLKGKLDTRGKQGAAGTVRVTALESVVVPGGIQVNGKTTGGTAEVTGGTVTFTGRATARGRTGGGSLTFTANTGDLRLEKSVDASGPAGRIVGAAPNGNLTTRGRFRAGLGGCIGLSAGATIDTAGSTFDVPLQSSCP